MKLKSFLSLRPRPVVAGTIDRRILVNYRCDPAMAARLLPRPFVPKLIRGQAMVGLCLIRLKNVRPVWTPAGIGIGIDSENAAHRIAVEWMEGPRRREGVYVLRRETNSRLNVLAGGRLFPGVHSLADFTVWESPHRFKIDIRSGPANHNSASGMHARVIARMEDANLAGSIFASLQEVSDFFAAGALGWSATAAGDLEGLELRTFRWEVEPLFVERVESSFFDDRRRFPPGTIAFDNALLMREVPHEWHPCAWTATRETTRPSALAVP